MKMKLQKILSRFLKLHPKEIDLSLDRINFLCKKLGNPQNKIKAISVVGTNGKNSTIQACYSILKEANIKCNVYTSPHIQRINERFIFNNKELEDDELSEKIRVLTRGFKDEETFFIKRLSYGVAKIASAFYPKQAIVRMSDFKSNEYYNLLGGNYFEPTEENPMIGWRGAARYYSDQYEYAFGMECKAIKRVRDKMGLNNVTIMIPFCRTVEELQKVYKVMKKYGLERGKDGLQVYLMAELPSNILMAEEFSELIDGFSIGSNDLTQLTLGLDRDSSLVAHIYNERNPAVKRSISNLIKVAKKTKTKVGICGQGPSDYPDFAQFLVEEGIDTISVTPDSMLKTIKAIHKIETKK